MGTHIVSKYGELSQHYHEDFNHPKVSGNLIAQVPDIGDWERQFRVEEDKRKVPGDAPRFRIYTCLIYMGRIYLSLCMGRM